MVSPELSFFRISLLRGLDAGVHLTAGAHKLWGLLEQLKDRHSSYSCIVHKREILPVRSKHVDHNNIIG